MKKKNLIFILSALFLALSFFQAYTQEESQEASPHIWPAHQPEEKPPETIEVVTPQEALRPQEALKQLVDVNFQDMDLKRALSILAETYDLNILAGDEVKGAVTINFKQVPLEDILAQILKLKDFAYQWEGSIIKVISAAEDVQTRVFSVNHISLDLAQEVIADNLSDQGKIRLNLATNQLIITDITSKLDSLNQTLADIDKTPQQVRIETRLIDVSHNDLNNLGVVWTTSGLNVKVPGGLYQGGKTVLSQADYSNAGTSSTLSNGQFTFGFAQRGASITATIDALIRETKAKVIANPSITTLNSVEARITIGTKYPIREQTQTSTGTLETTRFVDVGTTLRVTPKINADGTIQLKVHPEVSSVASTVDAGPVITTREADTTVIVNDGETLIIAGLLQTEDNLNKSRIPILGSIPFIGKLFSSQDKDKDQKELVIFMTPQIIDVAGKIIRPQADNRPTEVELVAERVEAAEMFDKAEDLAKGISLQAKAFPRKTRLKEAAKTYQRISFLFPDNYYADVGLYKAGYLYETKLKNYPAALDCYRKILSNYPQGVYLAKAKQRIRRLERLISKTKRQ
jgi:type IV pilus assembly protein PilQ